MAKHKTIMYKVKGTITSIDEVKTLGNGAKVVNYIVDQTSENGYVTKYNIGLYKKAEYAEHVDNFIKYNKVGDEVEVEFTIRSQEYNGKIYNNLNHWKLDKVGATTTAKEDVEDLPF